MVVRESLARYHFAKEYILNNSSHPAKVLDIACGDGYGTKILAESGNLVYGVDKNPCFRKVENRNAVFKVMDCTRIRFRNGYFDFVVSFETIEHIRDYPLFLDQVTRVLKQNGTLILSTPNLSFSEALYGKYLKKALPYHVKEFRTKELQDILKRRFESVEILIQNEIIKSPFVLSLFSFLFAFIRYPKIVEKRRNRIGIHNLYVCRNKL